jgi:hypothetical protein
MRTQPAARPSTRTIALSMMRAAGYHGDGRARVRLLVERRVNRADMERAWAEGESLREIAGVDVAVSR